MDHQKVKKNNEVLGKQQIFYSSIKVVMMEIN